jgi:hypothetical protein
MGCKYHTFPPPQTHKMEPTKITYLVPWPFQHMSPQLIN